MSQQSQVSSLSLSPKSQRLAGSLVQRRSFQRLPRPPQRLSLPANLSQESNRTNILNGNKQMENSGQATNDGVNSNQKKASTRKRARFDEHQIVNDTSNTNDMWIERFKPKTSSELCVAPKKVKEIKEWMDQAIVNNRNGRNKLLVLVGSPGVGKSTTIRVLAKELRLSVQSWNESFHPRSYGVHANNLLSVEQSSALDSFQEFLQQSGSGLATLPITLSSSTEAESQKDPYVHSRKSKSLILLEELPNLHGPEADLKFRSILSRHLQWSQVPTVLVFSEVCEGKHRAEDLERLIDPNDLYDNERSTILQIHSVTKPKMKKILTAIGKQQRCSINANLMETLHSQSRGDIRHAIMTLQMNATASTGPASVGHGLSERDTKLSTFHCLGKLLYAKRKEEDGRFRLAFDPDSVLEGSDMGLNGSLRFLEYHSPDFFSDITDLSDAYRYFSDSLELLDNAACSSGNFRQQSHDLSVAYPFGCAGAIAGRAVANTNRHPAPNKFRQFSRPKVFDVIRNMKQNQTLVEQLSRRLSTYHLSVSTSIVGDTGKFVTDVLPLARIILPQEVDPLVENLYIVSMQRHHQKKRLVGSGEDDSGLKDQEEILGMDDIDEFDSDNE